VDLLLLLGMAWLLWFGKELSGYEESPSGSDLTASKTRRVWSDVVNSGPITLPGRAFSSEDNMLLRVGLEWMPCAQCTGA
jgi:hypothetical protein